MQNINGKTALGLDQNVGALLCYLGNAFCSFGLVYSVIVVTTDKTNKLVRFHAFQSILYWILAVVLGSAAAVIILIAGVVDGFIGFPLFSLLFVLVLIVIGIALLIVVIKAVLSAYRGEIYKMPLIGNLANKWASTIEKQRPRKN